ncbi:MAG: methylenetetrahydrofolate--tRNA-(uracil(54)-C(5))-methyltransferase (FADH(2)-oxidizing) TrmFO [Nitrospiria bacterium]
MSSSQNKVIVVGGGLAGSEAAWQAAEYGADVVLYEMRPVKMTPAHKTGHLAELVCSNSLGSHNPVSAPGLLKEEMRRMGSLVMQASQSARVPAGGALAVDREIFSKTVSEAISGHSRITILHEEVKEIPSDTPVILSTGPLTSDPLAEALKRITRSDHLSFFDAISPIVDVEEIDRTIVFSASRYGNGGDDYLNCPMDEAQYDAFYHAIMQAERVASKPFEKVTYFEGCLPIEVLAERGKQTPLFGPMKPVGLIDPKTGKQPFAVVQLRAENRYGTAYSLVGFQTKLKYPEQQRVFRMIPGLETVSFLRLGSLHRNTFINAPRLLSKTLQFKTHPGLFVAGQIIGVEGYVESAAMGGLCGINAARILSGTQPVSPPETTAHGALIQYVTESSPAHFQPINSNFGLFPPVHQKVKAARKIKKALRHQMIVDRALEDHTAWMRQYKISDDISK